MCFFCVCSIFKQYSVFATCWNKHLLILYGSCSVLKQQLLIRTGFATHWNSSLSYICIALYHERGILQRYRIRLLPCFHCCFGSSNFLLVLVVLVIFSRIEMIIFLCVYMLFLCCCLFALCFLLSLLIFCLLVGEKTHAVSPHRNQQILAHVWYILGRSW